ncbi:uncharacterized [Tachysurus ichikawai]
MNPHIHQASFQLIKETQKAEEAEVLDESLEFYLSFLPGHRPACQGLRSSDGVEEEEGDVMQTTTQDGTVA